MVEIHRKGRWEGSEYFHENDYVLASDYAALDEALNECIKDRDWFSDRLDAATAELARVKAESLRVVVVGKACDILAANSQYVTDEDGELWECHPEPADDGREVRSVLTGCGGYFTDTIVQPVRLERWDANDDHS